MKHRFTKKISFAAILATLLVLCSTVGVLAYLSVMSGSVTNTFTAAPETDPAITESFAGNIKSDVCVQVGDTGYDVYVRGAIVVTWKNSAGNVLALKPVLGTDYTMTLDDGTNWFEKDGFYYHKAPVSSNVTSAELITEAKPLKDAPEADYYLSVEIVAQTIQALGSTDEGNTPAVTAAWGVKVNDVNGNLIPE